MATDLAKDENNKIVNNVEKKSKFGYIKEIPNYTKRFIVHPFLVKFD